MTKVLVLVGCNYPPGNTRAEAGDVVDVDEKIAKALIRAGAAEPQKALTGDGNSSPSTDPSDASSQADSGGEG